MRIITNNTKNVISQRFGAMPQTFVELYLPTGVRRFGSTTEFSCEAKLLNVRNIESQSDESSIAGVDSISFDLSDNDGSLKSLLDNYQVYGCACKVYQVFAGLTDSDKMLLMSCKISTPITWNESDRIISITAVSTIESDLVSSLTQDELNNPECTREFPPIVFGSVSGLRAVSADCIIEAHLLETIYSDAQGWDGEKSNIIVNKSVFKIFNGYKFPRGPITLLIDGTLFYGQFGADGDPNKFACMAGGFNMSFASIPINSRLKSSANYENPATCWVADATLPIVGKYARLRYVLKPYQIGTAYFWDEQTGAQRTSLHLETMVGISDMIGNMMVFDSNITDYNGQDYLIGQNGDSAQILAVKGKMDFFGYDGKLKFLPEGCQLRWEIPVGTSVELYKENNEFYANWIPSDAVLAVYGKMNDAYCPVSPDAYTVSLNPHTVITMKRNLTDMNINWSSNDIYVALKSSVSSNVVDCIKYLIEHYTSLTCDTESFARVREYPSVKNYPVGFALTSPSDVINLIQDICYQAHLKVIVDAGVFYIEDMAQRPTPADFTINTNNTEFGSFKVETTPISEVFSYLKGEYTATLFPDDQPKYIIRKNNVVLFKNREKTISFWIYRHRRCVEKAMDFYLKKLSTIWHGFEVNTMLNSLNLQVNDTIKIAFPFSPATTGMVTGKTFNAEDCSITLKVWTPHNTQVTNLYDITYTDVVSEDFELGDTPINIIGTNYFPDQIIRTKWNINGGRASGTASAIADALNKKAKVVEVFPNYLKCEIVNNAGNTSSGYSAIDPNREADAKSTTVYVALPLEFQKAYYDGKILVGNLTDRYFVYDNIKQLKNRSYNDTQFSLMKITPAYTVDSVIDIRYDEAGFTFDEETTKSIGKIVWIDTNSTARNWGAPYAKDNPQE